MKRPEISVIIPIYNTSQYLEQCILSITNQTFKNIEIICVDDGSKDNSLDILKKLANEDTRIIIIHRETSSGSAAVPRNTGLNCARGKYVIFVDSDDFFDIEMLKKMYDCAEKKNADLVMCDNYVISSFDGLVKDCDGELHHKYIEQKDVFCYKDIPETIFQISNSGVWHKLILRDRLVENQLKFQEDVPSLDDVYFVIILLVLSKKIYILDEKLVFYRDMRPGAQTTLITKHKESIFVALSVLNKYLKEIKLYDEVKVSLQNWMLDLMAWWYYLIKDYNVAKELFLLYKNIYFKGLDLLGMYKTELYNGNAVFYNYILYEEYRPSVGVILNTISPNGGNLVLYGAGELGKRVYKNITNNEKQYTIKIWCDINAERIGNALIQKPEKIKGIEYDAILIAIARKDIVLEVKNYLKSLGVDENKIYTI